MLNAALITQARMTSTRLPGKVMKEILNCSLLDYHLNRLMWAQIPIIVATTTNTTDEPIVTYCKNKNIQFYRGSENDVLSRFYETALKNNIDLIIRVTSDCPLVDGLVIKDALEKHKAQKNTNLYTSNVIQRSFPRGFDFEIFSFDRLKKAHFSATTQSQREHVTPYLNQNIDQLTDYNHILDHEDYSPWRLTVDTEDDFKLIKELIQQHNCGDLKYAQIKHILKDNQNLMSLNQHIEQKKN